MILIRAEVWERSLRSLSVVDLSDRLQIEKDVCKNNDAGLVFEECQDSDGTEKKNNQI